MLLTRLLLAAALAPAALSVPALAQGVAPGLDAFLHLPAPRREQIALELATHLPDVPYVRTVRELARLEAPTPRHRRLQEKRGKRALPDPDPAVAVLPRRVQYVFGVGNFEATPPGAHRPPRPSAADADLTVHEALLGAVPGADLALAHLLARLDRDASADEFAAFLHAWRNGDESFYEALDRTAGTADSVFFFDAMLGDFRTRFVRGDDASARALRGSLQAAHDALHDGFLAYRQYRALREAVAWALILPPDLPLPRNLRRYEEKVAGSYSLRQQVTMVCHLLHGDVARVAEEFARTAPPLPDPLWSREYEPYPPWNATFAALVPRMVEAADSTDAFLAEAEAERRRIAAAITAAAQAAMTTH